MHNRQSPLIFLGNQIFLGKQTPKKLLCISLFDSREKQSKIQNRMIPVKLRTEKESDSGFTSDIINNLINNFKIVKIKNNLSYYLLTILNEFYTL